MKPNIKDIIKDNTVVFSHYRESILYYTVNYLNSIYQFPVPISDIGNATFNAQERAIFLMRYIRKSLDEGTFVKIY